MIILIMKEATMTTCACLAWLACLSPQNVQAYHKQAEELFQGTLFRFFSQIGKVELGQG